MNERRFRLVTSQLLVICKMRINFCGEDKVDGDAILRCRVIDSPGKQYRKAMRERTKFPSSNLAGVQHVRAIRSQLNRYNVRGLVPRVRVTRWRCLVYRARRRRSGRSVLRTTYRNTAYRGIMRSIINSE